MSLMIPGVSGLCEGEGAEKEGESIPKKIQPQSVLLCCVERGTGIPFPNPRP
jgi:hypothetical protein